MVGGSAGPCAAVPRAGREDEGHPHCGHQGRLCLQQHDAAGWVAGSRLCLCMLAYRSPCPHAYDAYEHTQSSSHTPMYATHTHTHAHTHTQTSTSTRAHTHACIGNKVVKMTNVGVELGGRQIIKDFSYNFIPGAGMLLLLCPRCAAVAMPIDSHRFF